MSERGAPERPPPAPGAPPPAFVIAAGVSLVVGIALTVFVSYLMSRQALPGEGSWSFGFFVTGRSLVSTAAGFAVPVLLLVGFAELVRRAGPGLDGRVLQIGRASCRERV